MDSEVLPTPYELLDTSSHVREKSTCSMGLSGLMLVEQLNPEGWARTYLVVCEIESKAVLIDPVLENNELYLGILELRGLELDCVIGTHTHADHITGGFLLAEEHGCDFLMLEGSACHGVTRFIKPDSVMEVGGVQFSFTAVPGHTEDSMLVEAPGHLFTGDFLFNGTGGVGRDDLPGGSLESHWESIGRLVEMDGDLLVMSGHEPPGSEPASLQWNRENNPVLLMESFEEYQRWQRNEWLRLGDVSRMPVALPANLTGVLPSQ